jgi:hypothetical protein
MASESNCINVGARLFKFLGNIVNIVVIFICGLEGQRVMSILKMLTFMYVLKFFPISHNFEKYIFRL